jgi:HK97 family phage major capsid protein
MSDTKDRMRVEAPAVLLGGRYGRKDGAPGGPAPGGDTERQFKEAIQGFKNAADAVKRDGETLRAEMKSLGEGTAETKGKVDEALSKMGELRVTLDDLAQKMARGGGSNGSEGEQFKSAGQRVADHEKIAGKEFTSASRGNFSVRMSRKDMFSATGTWGTGVSAATSLTQPDRQGLVAPPLRRLTIRDLLIPGETGTNAIEYPRETGFTNAAAPVAEGAVKPKSDLAFDLKTAPVRTIAHIFKGSRQLLDDAPQLRTYIDGRARYGLQLKEEQQLISGDGTGANILGLLPQSTAFAPAAAATPANATALDRLRLAILQVTLAELPASGFVLNPVEWAGIELTKDTTGRYIIANPQGGIAPTLWNLPVVATIAMTSNRFLCGAFDMAAQIFDRMEIEVLVSTENEDDFVRNMVTFRAEERLALAVYRPEALVTGLVVPAA